MALRLRAATPLGLRPSSGATSAGLAPSISVCQRTAIQRSGSDRNARTISESSRLGQGCRSAPFQPLVTDPPQGGQQVRPERIGGAAAEPDDLNQLIDCLCQDVIDVRGVQDKIAGQPPCGLLVPPKENPERCGVPGPHHVEKFRVICTEHDALFVGH